MELTASEVITLVTGSSGAIVLLLGLFWMFTTGRIVPRWVLDDRDRQIADWKKAHEAERQRADSAITALQATNQVLAALHREVAQ